MAEFNADVNEVGSCMRLVKCTLNAKYKIRYKQA